MPFVKFWGPVVSEGSLFHEKATVEMHVRLPLIIEIDNSSHIVDREGSEAKHS